MTEVQFHELIYYVCKRPKLYTPTGSFFEVASFLEGLGSATKIENNHAHSKFTGFMRWMAARLNKDGRFPISWIEFAEIYSSDSEAIEALPVLYNQYLSEDKLTN
jgi:hypothetical protein